MIAVSIVSAEPSPEGVVARFVAIVMTRSGTVEIALPAAHAQLGFAFVTSLGFRVPASACACWAGGIA